MAVAVFVSTHPTHCGRSPSPELNSLVLGCVASYAVNEMITSSHWCSCWKQQLSDNLHVGDEVEMVLFSKPGI